MGRNNHRPLAPKLIRRSRTAAQGRRAGWVTTDHEITYGAALMTARVYPVLARSADANANLFISPVSLSQGLGLAFIGARGETREEIGRVLG